MGKLTYQIEVLTPVHVGNGRQILPPEYVLDSEARKIVRVDLDSLFREKGFPIVRYINAVRQPGFYLGSEFRTASVRHPCTSLHQEGIFMNCPVIYGDLRGRSWSISKMAENLTCQGVRLRGPFVV